MIILQVKQLNDFGTVVALSSKYQATIYHQQANVGHAVADCVCIISKVALLWTMQFEPQDSPTHYSQSPHVVAYATAATYTMPATQAPLGPEARFR